MHRMLKECQAAEWAARPLTAVVGSARPREAAVEAEESEETDLF